LTVTIRPARADDAAELVQVARQSIEVTAAPFYDVRQLDVWLETFTDERMRQFADEAEAFVGVAESTITGFAGLVVRADGDGELEFLHVRPEFAGRGIARELIEAVENAARQQSLNRLWADASLLARPVLEHLGYSVFEAYVKVVRGATFDNAWLYKSMG
jgi:putative acetyltransferase